jgi:hypothetical protein
MASTYSTNLKLELIGTGDQSGTWGATTNTNMGTLIEQAIAGYATQAVTDSGVATVLTIPDGASSTGRNYVITLTGALTAARTVEVPAVNKPYIFFNSTTGGFAVTVKVTGQTGVVIANGKKAIVYTNTTDVIEVANAPATEAGTQTLTNKTLTAPVIATIVNTGTLTLPTSTDTLVGRATTDTLTNKTLTAPIIGTVIGGTTASSSLTLQSTSGVGTTDSILLKVGNNGATTAMTVDTSGNVCIGTGSPTNRLTISGNVNASNYYIANSATTDAGLVGFSNSNGPSLQMWGSAAAGSGAMIFIAAGSEQMRINANGAVGIGYSTLTGVGANGLAVFGNVGIATATPGAKLQVIGSTTVSSQANVAAIIGAGGTSDLLLGSVNGNTPFVASQGAYPLTFRTNANEQMRIDSSGNVGIGAVPSYLLDVQSTSTSATYYAERLYSASNPSGVSATYLRLEKGTGYGGAIGGYISQGVGSGLVLATANGGTFTDQMWITNAGNVGIGVVPAGNEKLRVEGTEARIRSRNSTSGADLYMGAMTPNEARLWAFTPTDLTFGTNNTECMRIGSNGNVGIGTSGSAANKLVVNATSQYTGILLNNTTNTVAYIVGTSATNDDGQLVLSSGGVTKVNLLANGNSFINGGGFFGVGTNNPSTTLDVNGAIRINDANSFQWYGSSANTNQKIWDTYTDNFAGNTLYFRAVNDAYSVANNWLAVGRSGYTIDYVAFFTASGSEKMRIDSSGNVGIGTTANASAILDAQSTTKGVRFPNMTTTQKNAISSPAAGLVVFDTTLAKLCVYSGSAWQTITSI